MISWGIYMGTRENPTLKEEYPLEMTLRQAIIQRVHDKNNEELKEIIQDSIGTAEAALPGIGVLFEIIWSHSGNEQQESMVQTLREHMNDHPS